MTKPKICSQCKVVMKKIRNRAIWKCPKCGRERDYELLAHIFPAPPYRGGV